MNITAKSRYALKIMMDLADSSAAGKQQRHKIAARQGISVDFMDHIMARLRSHNLITSTRGRMGGFELGRAASAISLWDIFYAVEDNVFPVKCMDHSGCEFEDLCISYDAWTEVFQVIRSELSRKSLSEVVRKWQTKKHPLPVVSDLLSPAQVAQVAQVAHECKAPSRQASEKLVLPSFESPHAKAAPLQAPHKLNGEING